MVLLSLLLFKILRDPNLVQWFAQNTDAVRNKLTSLPIGLNCFEHAPEMAEALNIMKSS